MKHNTRKPLFTSIMLSMDTIVNINYITTDHVKLNLNVNKENPYALIGPK